MRRRMQIIFQDPYGSLDPRMTVGSIISEPIDTHHLASGTARKERVADLLRIVGLDPNYVSRYPHEFSGGQRQRIGVARALAVEPEFIVCDEPISALDVSIQAQVLNLLTDLREQLGLTYLFIAHDLSVVKHISDRVAVMYLGKIVEIGPPDIMYANPGHPYTRALLSAVPVPDPVLERKRKRVILTGDVPSPVNPPEGCRFHTRCWLYERLGKPEQCRTIDPPILTLQGDHGAACHFAEQARATDVGVAHIEMSPVRRGTPEAALATIRPEDGGAQSEAQTVAVAETVIGTLTEETDATDGSNGAAARRAPASRAGATGSLAGQPASAGGDRRLASRHGRHLLRRAPGPRKWHARQVIAADVLERPARRSTQIAGIAERGPQRAARVEPAAGRRVDRAGHVAGQDDALAADLGIGHGDRRHQGDRVRMLLVAEQVDPLGDLGDAARGTSPRPGR